MMDVESQRKKSSVSFRSFIGEAVRTMQRIIDGVWDLDCIFAMPLSLHMAEVFP